MQVNKRILEWRPFWNKVYSKANLGTTHTESLFAGYTARCVINNLKKIFARFGVHDEVVSDYGSQYSNTRNLFSTTHEFKQFAEEWGFRHTTSSPEYPQSNGAAERAVQTVKRIFKKAAVDNKDPFEGLLKYRNTSFEDIGESPVQLLTSRRTRIMIPTHRRLLLPHAVDPDQVVKALKQRQSVSKKNYDKQSRDLPPLEAGDKVRIRPNRDREWRKAEVLPRSYLQQDEQGHVYRRNGKQIISVPNDHPMPPQLHPVCPQLHDPSLTSQCADVPMSPLSPKTEKQAPGPMELAERPAGNAENSPIATRSGRQVGKP